MEKTLYRFKVPLRVFVEGEWHTIREITQDPVNPLNGHVKVRADYVPDGSVTYPCMLWSDGVICGRPLAFIHYKLDDADKLGLLRLFKEGYENTDLSFETWAPEFAAITLMLLGGYLVLNPGYLHVTGLYDGMEEFLKGGPDV